MHQATLLTGQFKRAVRRTLFPAGLVLALTAGLNGRPSAADGPTARGTVDFSRDILPIFSDNCFQCHGPDEKGRKGKLRLDTKEGAFRVKDGKIVIVPGKSATSELFRRITTQDSDDLMPPPESNHKLTARQIALIHQWIDEGAQWGRHWAFNPIQAPRPPRVKNKHWPVNDIDRFVLARLEQEGLAPSPA